MAETQKFMGRNQLIDRLSAQVGSRDSAIKILQQRGQDVHSIRGCAGCNDSGRKS